MIYSKSKYDFQKEIERDENRAFDLYHEQQDRYKRRKERILVGSAIGWFVVSGIVTAQCGHAAGALFFFGTGVAYALGYYYCESIWRMDKESSDYYEALETMKAQKRSND